VNLAAAALRSRYKKGGVAESREIRKSPMAIKVTVSDTQNATIEE
jgi:hypothetical protein